MHFAFAYGYKDLGKYLLSLGADDTVANVHGMTCYEGLTPTNPARLSEHAGDAGAGRSAELRRRVDAMRPGAGAGAGAGDRVSRRDDHAPARATQRRGGPRAGQRRVHREGASGTAPSRREGVGREGSEYDVGSEYGAAYPYTPRDVPGYGPGNVSGAVSGAYGAGHPGYPPNPYAAPGAAAPPPPPYPAYPPTMTPGFHAGYGPMDPMGAAAFAAQQQMAAAAAMAAQMQAMQMSSPTGSMGSTHSPIGSHSHGSGAVVGGSMPTGFQPANHRRSAGGGAVSSRGSAVGGVATAGRLPGQRRGTDRTSVGAPVAIWSDGPP